MQGTQAPAQIKIENQHDQNKAVEPAGQNLRYGDVNAEETVPRDAPPSAEKTEEKPDVKV